MASYIGRRKFLATLGGAAAAISIALREFPRQFAESAFFGQEMWLPDKKRRCDLRVNEWKC